MSVSDYGLNAYKETLYSGYKRFAAKKKSESAEAPTDEQDGVSPRVPPPDIWGRVMDFKA